MSSLSDFIGGGTPPVWVSGATYAQGKVVVSPVDFCYYVRKVAGAGSTDPSSDTTNWQVTGRAIKSIQRGVCSVSATATVTITSVNTAKTEVRFLGASGGYGATQDVGGYLSLTNSTTLTVTFQGAGVSRNVAWELTERF